MTKYGNKSVSKGIEVKAPARYLCPSFRAEGIALNATLEKMVEMTTGVKYGANFRPILKEFQKTYVFVCMALHA